MQKDVFNEHNQTPTTKESMTAKSTIGQYYSQLSKDIFSTQKQRLEQILEKAADNDDYEDGTSSKLSSAPGGGSGNLHVQPDAVENRSNEIDTLSDCDLDSTRLDISSASLQNIHHDTVNFVLDGQSTAPAALYDADFQPPIPVLAVPQYDANLPFPDKSGNISTYCYGHKAVIQAPPPSPFSAAVGYPTVYVSPAGLITVLLKYDIAVELTVERNIRVVNHRHKAVAATNNRGNTNFVYHVAAKVFNEGSKTEVEIFGERRARMQADGILFSSGMEVYLLDDNHIVPSHFCFNDMSKDCSVNVLFDSSAELSSETLLRCEEITKASKYFGHKSGATMILINGIKICQDEFGELQVTAGPKFISTSPVYGSIYLQTPFVEVSMQVNWNVLVKRGQHHLNASYTNFVVGNRDHEAGFDQYREIFSRVHNSMLSEFENWLPSLTYLCQGVPQSKSRIRYSGRSKYFNKDRNRGAGDQLGY